MCAQAAIWNLRFAAASLLHHASWSARRPAAARARAARHGSCNTQLSGYRRALSMCGVCSSIACPPACQLARLPAARPSARAKLPDSRRVGWLEPLWSSKRAGSEAGATTRASWEVCAARAARCAASQRFSPIGLAASESGFVPKIPLAKLDLRAGGQGNAGRAALSGLPSPQEVRICSLNPLCLSP